LKDLGTQLIDGLYEMIKKHLPLAAQLAYKGHGNVSFGEYPNDLSILEQRSFLAWEKGEDGSYTCGEHTKLGIADGRGIKIDPGQSV
jgi:hypothetical protein